MLHDRCTNEAIITSFSNLLFEQAIKAESVRASSPGLCRAERLRFEPKFLKICQELHELVFVLYYSEFYQLEDTESFNTVGPSSSCYKHFPNCFVTFFWFVVVVSVSCFWFVLVVFVSSDSSSSSLCLYSDSSSSYLSRDSDSSSSSLFLASNQFESVLVVFVSCSWFVVLVLHKKIT